MKKIFFFFFFFINILPIFSQEFYENKVFDPNVQTVLIHKEGSDLTYPIISLEGNEKIVLSFDYLSKEQETNDYQYTIIHCTSNWEQSDLMFSEYIDGFEENDIENYDLSFSTFCKYVNYQITFPNDYLKFTKSGNYVVKVYSNYNTENVILTKRFSVTENLVLIDAQVKRTTNPAFIATSQEIDFTVNYSGYQIKNPVTDVKVILNQNNRWDNNYKILTPRFIKQNVLDYNYDLENVFEAGNEFHYFDGKELKFISEKVYNVQFESPYYHLYLVNDIVRTYEPFISFQDINGKRLIKNNNAINFDTESDYCVVHFTLKRSFPFTDGDVYVLGEFCDWNCLDYNKMKFNYDTQQYEAQIFLKQGYYNYIYALKNKNKISSTDIEGNFYQAENDYIIYVYNNDSNLNYDRLIGVKIVNPNDK